MTRSTRLRLAALLVFLCGSGVAGAQGPTSAPPQISDGKIVSQAGGYSFDLPSGWVILDDAQEGPGVRMQHEESGAYFWIQTKPRRGTTDEEFTALKIVLPFAGGAWHLESDGYRKIGGKRAGEIVSTRTLPDTPPLTLHNYAIVQKPYAYLMEFGVSQPRAEERDADRAKILDSFTWLKTLKNK